MEENMRSRIRIIIPVLLILVILGAAFAYLYSVSGTKSSGLSASGTVEAIEVTISAEIAGKVVEVSVQEGDEVTAGDTLIKLDDTLFQAQLVQAETALGTADSSLGVAEAARNTAQAALDSARVQYQLAFSSSIMQENAIRENAWRQIQLTDIDLPVWYFQKTEQISASQNELQAAQQAWADSQTHYESVISAAGAVDFAAVEKRVSEAQTAFENAQAILDRADAQTNQDLKDAAQSAYDDARTELDSAQIAYTQALSEEAAQNVIEARAELAVAQERYDSAHVQYLSLLTGEQSLQVQVAQAVVNLATSSLAQAEAVVTQTQDAIRQAQAALNVLNVQKEKFTITAPSSGVILSLNIERGEVVTPGSAVMTIGKLDALTITVYVPEDRYGEISLGQVVSITTDSFPNEQFIGKVIRIADQAEYTPRNVQTEEGRRTTVFAIKLSVEDPSGRLKPGMPTDVKFY
jgi:HlyD family secretion protein